LAVQQSPIWAIRSWRVVWLNRERFPVKSASVQDQAVAGAVESQDSTLLQDKVRGLKRSR
jgi:hypothetical protein